MPVIKLKPLEKTPSQSKPTPTNSFVYKDMGLDLALDYTTSGELFKDPNLKDLVPIYDVQAVINAIVNIFTTSPGQKLLNPTFGLDLRGYLFDPVSDTRAFFIGNDILHGLPQQDPRVKIDLIRVTAVIDDQEYDIDLQLSIPSLNVSGITLKGVLNSNGYTFN